MISNSDKHEMYPPPVMGLEEDMLS